MIQWVFLLFGAWLIYLTVQALFEKKRALKLAEASVKWTSVPGTVTSSEISEGRNRDSSTGQMVHTYWPSATYSYVAGGAEHQSSRVAFGKIVYYKPDEAEAFMQKHAKGATVEVFYDPAAPAEAVLDRDPAHATRLASANVFMLVAGLAMMGAGLWNMLAK